MAASPQVSSSIGQSISNLVQNVHKSSLKTHCVITVVQHSILMLNRGINLLNLEFQPGDLRCWRSLDLSLVSESEFDKQ